MKHESECKNILLFFDELIHATSGTVIACETNMSGISSVSLDSRNCEAHSLFIPLRGAERDGHAFCESALENGAICFFVDEQCIEKGIEDPRWTCTQGGLSIDAWIKALCKKYHAMCICVKNTLIALQACARFYLNKFPRIFKIAVTGSSGKTTTKELLSCIIGEQEPVIFSEGNLNSETGLPLSVFKITDKHKVAIFEMGMNRKNEIAELASVFKPNIAVITNIGTAHIGMLGSQEQIALEKKQIFSQFDSNDIGFIPKDNWANFLSKDIAGTVIAVDIEAKIKDSFLELEDNGENGYSFVYKNEKVSFPLAGKHNLFNAALAVTVAEHLNIKAHKIKSGLEKVNAGFGRSQVVHGAVDYLFDAYNANPQSMEAAIQFLIDLKRNVKKIAIIGSMLELGEFAFTAHKKIIEMILHSNIDFIFLYGNEIVSTYKKLEHRTSNIFYYDETETNLLKKDMTDILENQKRDGNKCFVLLKGSRGLKLEQFISVLESVK